MIVVEVVGLEGPEQRLDCKAEKLVVVRRPATIETVVGVPVLVVYDAVVLASTDDQEIGRLEKGLRRV